MLHFSMEKVAFPLLLSCSTVKTPFFTHQFVMNINSKKMQKKYTCGYVLCICLYYNKLW